MRYNIIGFNNTVNKDNKHCLIHVGRRLLQSTKDPDLLFCPQCGMEYLPKDANTDEKIASKFGPQSNQSRIITPRTKRKYYDKQGNLITDPDLITEVQKGNTIISYHEYLPAGTSKDETKPRTKIIRR